MYTVVFERVKDGVRTSSSFSSEDDFLAWYTPEMQTLEGILVKGVSDEEAERLCMATPLKSYIQSVLDEAAEVGDACDDDLRDLVARMRLETIMAVYRKPFPDRLAAMEWLMKEVMRPGVSWPAEVDKLRALPSLVERLKRVVASVTVDDTVDNTVLFYAVTHIMKPS